jgi:hypothetical protein
LAPPRASGIASRFDTFDSKVFDDFVGVGEAQRRVAALDQVQLPADQAHAVQLLRTQITGWAEKKCG